MRAMGVRGQQGSGKPWDIEVHGRAVTLPLTAGYPGASRTIRRATRMNRPVSRAEDSRLAMMMAQTMPFTPICGASTQPLGQLRPKLQA